MYNKIKIIAPSAKKLSKPKSRKVLNIADKIKILNLLDDDEKVAAVGRKFNVNKSTVRTIRDNAANYQRKIKQSRITDFFSQ